MKKSANTIEINGRRFDVQTGQVMPHVRGSVDGVLGHKPALTTVLVAPLPKVTLPIVPLSTTKLMDLQAPKRRPRAVAKPVAGHQPQASHTLMRHVVKKPGKSLKRQHTAQGHTDNLVTKPNATAVVKKSLAGVPAGRLSRAQEFRKSAHISRFSQHVAVPTHQTVAIAPAVAVTKTSRPTADKIDIFEQALKRATSHQQPPVAHHKHPKRQAFLSKGVVSFTATALSVLLLMGFIGFENRTNLTLRMAASKAGFSASLPGYRPSGFSVGRLNYSAGNVAINFHSNSDRRAFAISEQPSAWDSASLRDNLVAQADRQFQTVGVAGRTVYIYGRNNAAWVNGGILYQVKTDGALSNKQLTQLAASL